MVHCVNITSMQNFTRINEHALEQLTLNTDPNTQLHSASDHTCIEKGPSYLKNTSFYTSYSLNCLPSQWKNVADDTLNTLRRWQWSVVNVLF